MFVFSLLFKSISFTWMIFVPLVTYLSRVVSLFDRTLSMNILDKPTTKTQSCFKIPQNITGLMNHGVLRLDVIRDIGEKGYYKLEDTGRCPSNPFSLSCTGWFLNDKIRGEMPGFVWKRSFQGVFGGFFR